MHSARVLLACVLVGSSLACGDADPKELTDEGYAALGRNQPEVALTWFEQALEGLGETEELRPRARMGFIKALVATDPHRARDEFLSLAKSSPLESRDYHAVARLLANEQASFAAAEVLFAAQRKFPEDRITAKMLLEVGQIVDAHVTVSDICTYN